MRPEAHQEAVQGWGGAYKGALTIFSRPVIEPLHSLTFTTTQPPPVCFQRSLNQDPSDVTLNIPSKMALLSLS